MFAQFGLGLATIFLNRVDKYSYAIVNNKSSDSTALFGVYVPTVLPGRYSVIRDTEEKLINKFPDLDNFYRADAMMHFLMADAQGKIWQDKLSKASQRKYWIYAPGPNAAFWDDYAKNGIMGVGWNEIDQDLTACQSLDELRSIFDATYKGKESGQQLKMLSDFLFTVSAGDMVFVKNGLSTIVGFGEVTSGYYYDAEKTTYRHRRKATWSKVGHWPLPTGMQLPQKTLTEVKAPARLQELLAVIDESPGGPPQLLRTAYSLSQCSQDTCYPPDRLERWVRAIRRKRQAVFFGPPGTGKTYIAQFLARHLVGDGDGFDDLIQFHPSYAYEDFILGIRPTTMDGGTIRYEMMPGRFKEFCDEAAKRKGICVLIIDEMNRANLSRVFGELMYLLEYRGKSIPLAGGKQFAIPSNVIIIGTMNTADRSIALVDHALRRRFAFLALYPDYELLEAYHVQTGFETDGLRSVLQRINDQIKDHNFHIGESYFLREELEEEIEDIWTMEIEPYLEEFFFDQLDLIVPFRWAAVKDDILT